MQDNEGCDRQAANCENPHICCIVIALVLSYHAMTKYEIFTLPRASAFEAQTLST